jgi:hypothetical protein
VNSRYEIHPFKYIFNLHQLSLSFLHESISKKCLGRSLQVKLRTVLCGVAAKQCCTFLTSSLRKGFTAATCAVQA